MGLLALAVALAAAALLIRARQQPAAGAGTTLGLSPATPFMLTDQNGQRVSLSQFRGEPVVLTFLYTSCPDVCPLIADKLHQTYNLLGGRASHVGILAITTDPAHDDRAAAVRFSQEHGMTGRWHFLLGSPAQLAPLWKDYYIGVSPIASDAPSGSGSVMHSDAVYVIDRSGRERTLYGADFEPKLLAHELEGLLAA
ncbi:MAG: SCO family protein [Chloroflexota bacterium]